MADIKIDFRESLFYVGKIDLSGRRIAQSWRLKEILLYSYLPERNYFLEWQLQCI